MKKIAFYLFGNNALFTFIADLLTIIAGMELGDTRTSLTPFESKAKTCLDDFEDALQRDAANPKTIAVQKADQARDRSWVGFCKYIDACMYREEEEVRDSATLIEDRIQKYGSDLYRYSYADQTAGERNFIHDMKLEPLATATTMAEAGKWFAQVESTELAFEQAMEDKTSYIETNVKTIGGTRKPLIDATRFLLNMVELQHNGFGGRAMGALMAQVNNHIESSMASARISYANKEKEEEVPGEEVNE